MAPARQPLTSRRRVMPSWLCRNWIRPSQSYHSVYHNAKHHKRTRCYGEGSLSLYSSSDALRFQFSQTGQLCATTVATQVSNTRGSVANRATERTTDVAQGSLFRKVIWTTWHNYIKHGMFVASYSPAPIDSLVTCSSFSCKNASSHTILVGSSQ